MHICVEVRGCPGARFSGGCELPNMGPGSSSLMSHFSSFPNMSFTTLVLGFSFFFLISI